MLIHNTHGGNVWAAARKYHTKPESFIDFSANINPLGPSPMAIEAMRRGICLVRHYPDPDACRLKMKLSQFLSVPKDNLVLGNGSNELIYTLARVLQPKRLVLPVPTFSEYTASLPGVPIERIQLDRNDGFALPVEVLADTLKPGDVLFLCNPNNPTGYVTPKGEIMMLAERADHVGATLVVDEAFMDFVDETETVLPTGLRNPALVVLGSLTKFFALPGLRLGYIAACSEMLSKVSAQLPLWRINTLAQMAGEASLEDWNYIMTTLTLVNREKEFLYYRLKDLPGLIPYPPGANFILVDCWNSGHTAAEICETLEGKGILVRNASNFDGLNDFFFRVAVRQRNENLKLLRALQEMLGN